MRVQADIVIEDQKKKLIEMQSENDKKQADVKGYVLQSTLKPYKDMDWKKISALQTKSIDPKQNIALAFREMAENAEKIGTLNISPDLLESVLQQSETQYPSEEEYLQR